MKDSEVQGVGDQGNSSLSDGSMPDKEGTEGAAPTQTSHKKRAQPDQANYVERVDATCKRRVFPEHGLVVPIFHILLVFRQAIHLLFSLRNNIWVFLFWFYPRGENSFYLFCSYIQLALPNPSINTSLLHKRILIPSPNSPFPSILLNI
ncbi:MAG: hypothetical protein MUP26_06870 [Desulfobulbaceae bacterium]|nr:hypothetical protein [Desulfobulbaceae bacterium]